VQYSELLCANTFVDGAVGLPLGIKSFANLDFTSRNKTDEDMAQCSIA